MTIDVPTILAYGAVGAVIVLFAVVFALSMEDAVQRRRAWNLWLAGIIDDDELRRRVDR